MKVVIDLNVFLDVEQRREPHFANSAAVLSAVLNGTIEGWMPVHCLTTLHYLIERSGDLESANKAVDWHLRHFSITDLNRDICRRARQLNARDFEDAVVAASAELIGCDWIVTRNMNDFANSPIPAISPMDFVKKFIQETETAGSEKLIES